MLCRWWSPYNLAVLSDKSNVSFSLDLCSLDKVYTFCKTRRFSPQILQNKGDALLTVEHWHCDVRYVEARVQTLQVRGVRPQFVKRWDQSHAVVRNTLGLGLYQEYHRRLQPLSEIETCNVIFKCIQLINVSKLTCRFCDMFYWNLKKAKLLSFIPIILI